LNPRKDSFAASPVFTVLEQRNSKQMQSKREDAAISNPGNGNAI